ncbi:ABC transporter substrate-binding protein [Aureimonas sp. ME7]|uniref:ABC transporter substrate-binding protein n=1 Tax=Aureimonas sp. ME7 TaxID=2744252 RepID=UPI0015F425FB|nr:ABC transporter substrate-binding protein [Aureimonas sp. ME7]
MIPCRHVGLRQLAALVSCLLAGPASAQDAPDAGRFPIAIEHSLGRTVIGKRPQRVAVLGVTDVDAVLALGYVPVLVNRWIPEWAHGVGPWAEPLLGGTTPLMFKSREIDLERVAMAEPDLIVGSGSLLDRTTYDKLSLLAPTTAPMADHPDPYATTWDVQTLAVGEALGRPEAAEALVERVQALFRAVREAHPSWSGRTAATLINWNGQMLMYAASDNRGEFLRAIGFGMPADLAQLAGNRFNVPISEERLDLLDQLDLIVVLTNDAAGRSFFEQSAVFRRLAPVKSGHVVYLDDRNLTMAMSGSTVLSIPYVLDALTTKIEQAIGK